jgi:hypothetical protein
VLAEVERELSTFIVATEELDHPVRGVAVTGQRNNGIGATRDPVRTADRLQAVCRFLLADVGQAQERAPRTPSRWCFQRIPCKSFPTRGGHSVLSE